MWLAEPDWRSVVAFVTGYDAAMSGGALWGFREWLVVRFDGGDDLAWPGLAEQLASRDGRKGDVEFLFGLLETFFAQRDTFMGGARVFFDFRESRLRRGLRDLP